MSIVKSHLNSLLLIAGFILMAGGGAELSRSEQNPEQAGPVQNPEGAFALYPEPNIIPALGPFPLIASDPEQPNVGALNPELANALSPEVATGLSPELSADEVPEAIDPDYDGQLERFAAGNMLRFIEGSFGALIMISAGIGAIVAGAFCAYKAAISLLFVALGAFILRALVSLFFGGGYDPYSVEFVGQGGL